MVKLRCGCTIEQHDEGLKDSGGIIFHPENPTRADIKYIGCPIDMSIGAPIGMIRESDAENGRT